MKKLFALLGAGVAITLAATPLLRRPQSAPPILRSAPAPAPAPAPTPATRPATATATATAEARLQAAEEMYWRGEHDSARIAWTELLAHADVATDSARIAVIQTWLGIAAWRLGEYETAREYGEAALTLKRRIGADSILPVSYNALGLLAWNEGRLTDAAKLYERGLELAERVGDVVTATKLAGNIGLVETEFARFDRARGGFERAYEMARATGETRLQGNALTNLAMLDVRVGNAAGAVPGLRAARRLYAQAGYPTGEQNALGQLSTAYAALGDLQRAFATLDSASALAAAHDLKQDIASNLEVMGDLYRDAGDARKALQQYQRAQALNRELGLEVERGTVLRKIASVQRVLGAARTAHASALDAARIHETTGARAEELKDRLLLAEYDAADDSPHLRRARELTQAIGTPIARSALALARAHAANRQDDHRAVLRLLSADLAAILQAGFDAEAEAAALRAEALARAQRPVQAAVAAAAAVNALESARTTLESGVLRAGFVAHRAHVYERLIGAQLQLGHTAEAFRISEHARLRDLGRLAATPESRDETVTALQRVRTLTDAVNALDEEIANGATDQSTHRDALARELADARAEYERLLARSTWRVRHSGVQSVADVQSRLRPDEVALEYFVGREHVYAFALTRHSLRGERLPVSVSALLVRVRLARAALGTSAAAVTGQEALGSLHDALVRPFEAELRSARRLVVAPHAALAYLPFAALYDRSSNRYLVERFAIAYAPGMNDLARARQSRSVARSTAATFFQPFPEQLPGSRAEASAMRRAWRGTRVLAAGRANPSALRAALTGDGIVHVSTHGALDPRSPLFSFISLAPASEEGARFEIHDVFATRVRASLVFLSGCETGLGTASSTGYETGDDANTFSNALLAAGARAVVATVWRIEDRSAALLAQRFYEQLHDHDATEALARAQRAMLRSGKYQAPFYWAAYMLAGEVGFAGAERAGTGS